MCRPGDSQLADELARLEKAYATSPEFMDRATHLLLVARSRRAAAPTASVVVPTPTAAEARTESHWSI